MLPHAPSFFDRLYCRRGVLGVEKKTLFFRRWWDVAKRRLLSSFLPAHLTTARCFRGGDSKKNCRAAALLLLLFMIVSKLKRGWQLHIRVRFDKTARDRRLRDHHQSTIKSSTNKKLFFLYFFLEEKKEEERRRRLLRKSFSSRRRRRRRRRVRKKKENVLVSQVRSKFS